MPLRARAVSLAVERHLLCLAFGDAPLSRFFSQLFSHNTFALHNFLMADVLLVDDNPSVLLTLAIALRRRGHWVTISNQGAQALNLLRQHRFDFLISDVQMPGMSGVQLASSARQLMRPPHIILTSAYSTLEAREGLAEAFLRKPIDIAQLDEMLRQNTQSAQQNPRSDEPKLLANRP